VRIHALQIRPVRRSNRSAKVGLSVAVKSAIKYALRFLHLLADLRVYFVAALNRLPLIELHLHQNRTVTCMARLLVLIGLVVSIGGGCASPQMKGTPFYTGEYTVRRGPVEDRVNLWPLLYYREPALSILWPIGELTEDHFAIRPVMSIYNRDKDDPVYNVLWPYARFDTHSEDYRIPPFFWGDDYFVGLPFYWHFDDPWGDGGYDGLLPLWSYRSAGKGRYSTHVLWPFIHLKHWRDDETGWRMWPVAGSYKTHGNNYRYAAWPVAHQWSRDDEKNGGSCIVPLYYHDSDDNRSLFLSLPYSRGEYEDRSWETVLPLYHRRKSEGRKGFYSLLYSAGEDKQLGAKWNLTLPLWYSRSAPDARLVATLAGGFSRQEDSLQWLALPLLSGGRVSEDSGNVWVGGPMAHVAWDGEYGSHHVLPFYYRSRTEAGAHFYSLLWSSGCNADDIQWQLLFPFMYRHQNSDSKTLITPLYAQGSSDNGNTTWNLALPLWYSRSTPDERLVATLAGGFRKKGETRQWLALPLLSGGRVSEDSGDVWAAAPLVHARWAGEYGSHHVLPFYYRSRTEAGSHFYSLLWSSGRNADDSQWQLLLPFMYRHQDSDSKTLITPLYAQGSSDNGNTTWKSFLPLVLNRKTEDEHLVATLLGGYRKKDDALSWLAYPLLAGGRVAEDESYFWAAAPLVHARWDAEHATHQVLPLYYWNGWDKTFISLPVTRWQNSDSTTTLIPPALSWMTQSDDRSDLWMFGALGHMSWGEDATSSHLFPLYYHNRKSGAFVSLLTASWENQGTRYRLLPPLLSLYTRENEERNLYGILGIFHQQWGEGGTDEGHLFPLYTYRENDYFLSLLVGWNHDRDGFVYPFTPLVGIRRGDYSGGWVFPFWSRRKHRESGDVNGTFLWGTYSRNGDRSRSGIIPFYGYENLGTLPDADAETEVRNGTYGKRFWSLPACWYRNETRVLRGHGATSPSQPIIQTQEKRHGFFPLWHYSQSEKPKVGEMDATASILLLLYDYKHEVRATHALDKPDDDYVRRRILWRLWHYERTNGDVSVDLFPAITYDKKTDGFRKFSFLWRFFRYENGPDGKKMDVLFVPVIRKASGEHPQSKVDSESKVDKHTEKASE